MVGIWSPEMLDIAWLRAASVAESSFWLSLMMIFSDTILPESAAALFVSVCSAVMGVKESEGEGEADVAVEADTSERAAGAAVVNGSKAEVTVVGVALDVDK